jgi:16S rRNA (adenine1518-N6/adenine1519-N6)-dimethyltransferase
MTAARVVVQMTNPDLDQHFLVDTEVLHSIVGFASLRPDDIVLEVGPGKGVLTREVAKYVHKVIAIEIDETLVDQLSALQGNVELLVGNALDLIDDISFNKVVANIPYMISEPLLKKLLKHDIDSAVLLVGANFTEVLSNPQSKWSKIVPLFFSFEKKLDVPPTAFDPAPKTVSDVIVLDRRKDALSQSEEILKEFVLQDDKKVKNALRYSFMRVFGLTKKQSDEKVYSLDLPPSMYEKNVDYLSSKQFLHIVKKTKELR